MLSTICASLLETVELVKVRKLREIVIFSQINTESKLGESCIPLCALSTVPPPDLSGSHTFPPSLPPPMRPPSLCYRATPWLWAKWGKAVGELRRTGSLQKTDSTFPKAQQVQQLCYSEQLWSY